MGTDEKKSTDNHNDNNNSNNRVKRSGVYANKVDTTPQEETNSIRKKDKRSISISA